MVVLHAALQPLLHTCSTSKACSFDAFPQTFQLKLMAKVQKQAPSKTPQLHQNHSQGACLRERAPAAAHEQLQRGAHGARIALPVVQPHQQAYDARLRLRDHARVCGRGGAGLRVKFTG